ncbi:MAG: methionyl-tRNA formyltransferase [Tenericutes bacterium HGW-Tenericutes-3]|nr:MAG: methionyl-tRNA formyltransferase [Tenericutes bacterium HGW-Tenericutes-3]
MKLVFMGTPIFSVPILETLIKHHQVLLVVTQPDKPVGRKRVLTQSPVKETAIKYGIEVFQPEKLSKDYQKIIDLKPDYIITAAYGQMLPKALITEIKALNVHGSLLPKYRGGAPIQYALFDGLDETGITIMYMAYQMDSGDIIKQERVRICQDDDYASLSHKLSLKGKDMIIDVLDDLINGKIVRTPQDANQVTFAYTLKRNDELLDFNQTSKQVINRVRGLSPEPGAHAYLGNQLIKFYSVSNSDIIIDEARPGTVLETKKKLIIKTKDGSVEVLEIQVPGKKQMAVKDFLNGQSMIQIGDVFKEGNE